MKADQPFSGYVWGSEQSFFTSWSYLVVMLPQESDRPLQNTALGASRNPGPRLAPHGQTVQLRPGMWKRFVLTPIPILTPISSNAEEKSFSFLLSLRPSASLCVSALILRSLRANHDRAVQGSEPRFMEKDLALPVRPGVISAVLALPRPLNWERRPPHRALSSPPKALRGPLHPQLLAPY